MNSTAKVAEHNPAMSYSTLIPVRLGEMGGEVVQVCNARDLHICLGVGRRFASWVVERIAEYGFVEGSDFLISRNGETKKGRGGDRRSQEYSLSVDMAKELAMVERTEAGRRIRRYFIDCEKRLRQIAPESAAEALRKALSPEQQHALSSKVHSKVACLEKARQRAGYSELWSSLKAKHQVARYQDIAQGEFDAACGFVDIYVWEGEWIKPEGKGGLVLNEADLLNLNALVTHAAHIKEVYQRYGLYEAFKKLGSHAGVDLHDHVSGAAFTAGALKQRFGVEMKAAHDGARAACDRGLRVAMSFQACA